MAQLRITKWNAERILAKAPRALEQVGQVLGAEAQKQISTTQYSWPNPTLRFTSLLMGGTPQPKGGVLIPSSPRDIVDTGKLLKSQTAPEVSVAPGKTVMTIRWLAPYSELVRTGGFYGSYVNPQGAIVTPGDKPGRDWIAKTLEARPPLPIFVDAWRSAA